MITTETLPARKGWGVAITRKDGTRFLSCGTGNGRAVWANCNRKWAVEHKRDLASHGFKCRVVPVLYSDPVIIESK